MLCFWRKPIYHECTTQTEAESPVFLYFLPLQAEAKWFVKDFWWLLSGLSWMSRVYFTLLLVIIVSWPYNQGPVSLSMPNLTQGIKSAPGSCRRSELTPAAGSLEIVGVFPPKVYIDEPTSFPKQLQKNEIIKKEKLQGTEMLWHFRPAAIGKHQHRLWKGMREISDHGADSMNPLSGWQQKRKIFQFSSQLSVGGERGKKQPLSNRLEFCGSGCASQHHKQLCK